ncbi:MAG: DegT/DnrJ/EryC1/StrS family aminotransferase [Bacteroidetes bacterium]|nr:MAG: DegT/DnrJ/EryC1/StrS family aminotransferase [Bacteroidota bacterium]
MKIPLVDLKSQYETIKFEIENEVNRVFEDCKFILGERVDEFEQSFADYCGVRYAVGLSSGTDALQIALRACGVGIGDEVITTPLSFIATCEAISLCGAKPVFVDIDYETYNIDVCAIEEKITERTKAIIPVHLYGLPCDLTPILQLSEKYDIKVIEDAAQAHGAKYYNKTVGSIGDVGCFSFYPSKNLGAYGDAGAIITNNYSIAMLARSLRNHGRSEKYTHREIGLNNRMDALQGAILNVKLRHLNAWNSKRRQLASLYSKLLANSNVVTPTTPQWANPVWHLYVIRVHDRDRIKAELESKHIYCGIHYPLPIHLQPSFESLGYQKNDFPQAERASNEILSLPIYPELKEYQVYEITRNIIELT